MPGQGWRERITPHTSPAALNVVRPRTVARSQRMRKCRHWAVLGCWRLVAELVYVVATCWTGPLAVPCDRRDHRGRQLGPAEFAAHRPTAGGRGAPRPPGDGRGRGRVERLPSVRGRTRRPAGLRRRPRRCPPATSAPAAPVSWCCWNHRSGTGQLPFVQVGGRPIKGVGRNSGSGTETWRSEPGRRSTWPPVGTWRLARLRGRGPSQRGRRPPPRHDDHRGLAISRQVMAGCRRCRGVPEAGFEPARPFKQWILSPPCLPFHHSGDRRMVARGGHRTAGNPADPTAAGPSLGWGTRPGCRGGAGRVSPSWWGWWPAAAWCRIPGLRRGRSLGRDRSRHH